MTVLVIGATGKQGGAVTRALRDRGVRVRALVRDPGAAAAVALRERGAELVRGDFDDRASLRAAVEGVDGLFSIPYPDVTNLQGDAEVTRARHLIGAAREAGVRQVVHSSVSGTGEHFRNAPGTAEGRWDSHYWETKAEIEELVRSGGFAHWTVLKPATFMENLLEHSFLFGDWSDGTIVTSFPADARLRWIAVDDIGAAAAAAFADPEAFHGRDIELAGDVRTMTEVAEILTEATGRRIEAPVLTAEEAVARGMVPFMARTVEMMSVVGSPADPTAVRALGLPTTDFRTWAARAFG